MARLTCSVRVVQLRIESRLWMEKLEDQLMSASGKLQRGMRWPVKVRKGPLATTPANSRFRIYAACVKQVQQTNYWVNTLRAGGLQHVTQCNDGSRNNRCETPIPRRK